MFAVAHRSLYTPVQLSQLHKKTAPKAFPKGLVALDQWIYECDPELRDEKANPHGVGKLFGQVKEPFGESLAVAFWDKKKKKWVNEMLQKTYARAAPPKGTQFTINGSTYTTVQYTHEGCHVHDTPVPSPKKAKKVRKTKAKPANAKPAKAKPVKAKPAKAKPTKAKPVKAKPKAKPRRAVRSRSPSPEPEPCSRWLRCRAPALSPAELESLSNACEGTGCENFSSGEYYIFTMRVAQEYKLRQKSACHFNNNNVLRAAVSQVFVQVRPKTLLPHDGDVNAALDTLLPVMQQVFAMPEVQDGISEDKWVQSLIKSDDYTYDDCYDYKELMQYHIKRECDAGREKDGFPIKLPDDVIPDGDNHYQATSTPKYNRSSSQPHKHLPFVRMASVNGALRDMKNDGVFFVAIKGEDMPNGVPWNNFAVAGHTFCAHYCRREGILRTQKLARQIQLFVFYGYFTWRTVKRKPVKKTVTKQKPVIFYLAKNLINGRSRLANGVAKSFTTLLSLIETDPSLATFLEDKGEGEPPMEYLIAIEDGLRSYADDIHAMGTKPLRSAYYWGNKVPRWRKREAYIALCRHVANKSPVYKQWDCFLFDDYAQRQRAQMTFGSRHLPLSNGEDELNFDGAYEFDWGSQQYSPKRKRVKVEKKKPRRRKKVVQSARTAPAGVMVFDVEKGCMVPM